MRRRPSFVPPVVLALVAVCSARAAASSRVDLAFVDPPTSAEYSQGVALQIALSDTGGAGLDGTAACGDEPCRVVVTMRAADGSGALVQVTEPDVVVDAAGRARARLVLVDGRHGGATFRGAPDGFAYTLTARFAGAGTPLPDADDVDCQPDAAVTADGRLCPAQATTTLLVLPETPALAFAADLEVSIGDTVTLAATLTDPNGDASGDDVDGPGPRALGGLPIRFAYDVNGNGRPEFIDGELLGEATTNELGVAAFSFTADPAFVTAGDFDAALHAEFPGDERYGVAQTSTALLVRARGPDAGNTIVEVDPTTLPADGTATATVTVKLVDSFGNLLGPDSDPHDVAIATDLGLLQDDVERSPLDGFYRQRLRAQRRPGTATIAVTVDGDDAGSVELVFEGDAGGCACSPTSSSGSPVDVAVAAFALFFVRRRRREVCRG
jgi:MYXO-CTERM domain-containing protein